MRNSAPSARRSMRGSPSSAAPAALDRVDCDLDFAAPAAAWIKSAIDDAARREEPAGNVVVGRFRHARRGEASREPVLAEVVEHINLNSSRSDKETVHLALGFDGAAPAYEPGDSLELFPRTILPSSMRCSPPPGLTDDDRLRQRADARARHHHAVLAGDREVRRRDGTGRACARCSTATSARLDRRTASSSISSKPFRRR